MPQPRYASFALALPLYRVFDYRIDARDAAPAGTRFRLPFTGGSKTGILLEYSDSSTFDANRIKLVESRLDRQPVLDAHMLRLARWIADYYQQPLGEVLFLCLPNYLRRARAYEPVTVERWRLLPQTGANVDALERCSPRQYQICIALAQATDGLGAAQLKSIHAGWRRAVKSLQAKGLVTCDCEDPLPTVPPQVDLPRLSDEQQAILNRIRQQRDRFGVHLLDGITGSGKTEIYLRLIADCLAAGRQAIYLVPEIGLTRQLLERVRARFGECFALSHSGLTARQRFAAWDQYRRGQISIMLGTRSSLFAQCSDLGLIIIDEEHDGSYRQADGVRYHARDVAIKRSQMLDIPILLGSATPALETLANCKRETNFHYRIERRPTRHQPASIQLVDIRNRRLEFGCSAVTLQRVEQHLSQGQVLFYLNRRGYAPVVMCHQCGWQAQCHHCDARLTLHQALQKLLCHHCGFGQPVPPVCPDCGDADIKHYGIGTERLERGLAQRFNAIPVLRIDRDTVKSRETLELHLEQLRSGMPCILLGTQMIAKGHDYPSITLSVVVDADQALFSAAYRASERLAQTLFQVAGRAGRGDREGEALVQTRFPDHPLMSALSRQSYRQIAANLLAERRTLEFPPYARAAIFRADARELEVAIQMLERIKTLIAAVPSFDMINCIGPLPALMARRVGRYRAQLCLLAQDRRRLRRVLHQAMPAIEALPSDARVNWQIDVDPLDL